MIINQKMGRRWMSIFLSALMAIALKVTATEWTVMVYLDADNNLEPFGIADFLEMAAASSLTGGASANTRVLVQFDRISGYDASYGDWTTCKRFEITSGMTPIATSAISDIGEADMGSPTTLQDFVSWGVSYAPANKYALVLWNHGGGWRLRHATSEKQIFKDVCYDDTSKSCLYTRQLRLALEGTGKKIDLIAFDACLMGMIEVAYELKDCASVFVASEQTVAGEGFPYNTIIGALVTTPTMTAAQFGAAIVDRFAVSSSAKDGALSAIDLTKLSQLATGVSDFSDTVLAAIDKNWSIICNSRDDAGYYTEDSYRDLKGFMSGVAAYATNTTIKSKAQAVVDIFNTGGLVIRNFSYYGQKANGLSLYFPANGSLVSSAYTTSNILFAEKSWDEFLAEWIKANIPAPTNDNFAASIGLTGATVSVLGSNHSATKESGEPNHAGNVGGHSVWWDWIAPVTGSTTISLAGSSFDTLLGIYIGSAVNTLTTIASNDDYNSDLTSQVTFKATAKTRYRIAVDGLNNAMGNIALSITQSAQPSATPNPAVVNDPVLFQVTTAISTGGTVTYAWNFGDGATGSGSSAIHSYAVAGTYVAQVTATDTIGNSIIGAVSVTVTESNKDGTDSLELTLSKIAISWKYKKDTTRNDNILAMGTFTVPEDFAPEGAQITVDVGGITANFALNDKGHVIRNPYEDKNNKLRFSLNRARVAKFCVLFKNGDFQQELTDLGLVNEDVTASTISVPVVITLEDSACVGCKSGKYKAKKNKKGELLAK